MKKMYFVLISVVVCAFLFVACEHIGVLDTEKTVSGTSTTVESAKGNNNDQGEDEGNRKKPPIVVPPKEDSNDDDQGEDEGNGKKPPVIDQPKDDPETDDGKVQNIPFQVGVINNSMGSRQNHNLFTIIRSKEELDNVSSERYYQYWTGTGGPYNVYYLKDFTEKYDSDYFSENALVLYLFTGGSGGMKMDVTEILKQGSELTIITDITWGMLTVITYTTVVLEVAKDDVYGVTTLISENLKRM